MNRIVITLLALACLFDAGAQKPVQKRDLPEEEITVNREFDDQGNLIRYDSLRVYKWSGDSLSHFSFDDGWEKLFGKDFFKMEPGHSLFSDSLFSGFSFPFDDFPFSIYEDETLFNQFRNFRSDSAYSGNFLFHNDSSLFLGPNSSFVLPPGFFIPDSGRLREMQELMDRHFNGFPYGRHFRQHGDEEPGRFRHPGQREEWEKLMEKQQLEREGWERLMEKQHQEREEFLRKWNRREGGKGFEKM